ncbi:MAG: hypothetical protein HN353_13810 [Bdellovibrionales bacterium]|nr:hypothetical protein [Bdellovibrionales bacterium]MBT3524830.1 hypothetical protein [Bdellovibrionales bacterium]
MSIINYLGSNLLRTTTFSATICAILIGNQTVEAREGGRNSYDRNITNDHIKRNRGDSFYTGRNWRQSYIGVGDFRLAEDRRLSKVLSRLVEAKDKHQQVSNRLKQKQGDLNKLQKKRDGLNSKIEKLNQQMVKLVELKRTKEKLIVKIDLALPPLRVKLQTKKDQITAQKIEVAAAQVAQQQAKKKMVEVKAKVDACTESCGDLKLALKGAQVILNEARAIHNSKQESLSTLQDERKVLAQTIKKQELKRVNAVKTNVEITSKIDNKILIVASLKSELQVVKQEISPLRQLVSKIKQRQQILLAELNKIKARRRQVRRNLIDRILEINQTGFVAGRDDGRAQGEMIAYDVGQTIGAQDGDSDGVERGSSEGRQREYRTGFAQGEVIGENRAQAEGEQDGTRLGTRDGNIAAATAEGRVAGVIRANNSDAPSVGRAQGERDGLARAERRGSEVGTPRGETEAIAKYEDRQLKKVNVDGAFQGTFSYRIPSFPGGSSSSRYSRDFYDISLYRGDDLAANYPRTLVSRAVVDGYRAGFFPTMEEQFLNLIGTIYQQYYNRAYQTAYNTALDRFYQESLVRGKADGEEEMFNARYPGIRDEFRAEFRVRFTKDPNRASSDYRNTYAAVEERRYQSRYEEIRADYYQQHEQSTYDSNIAGQTEHFRQLRFDQVDQIYTKNPVLKFVVNTIVDGGINGVAARDGVFQPEEQMIYSVTFVNYGKTAATNVKVVSDGSGKQITLPTIPAESVATVVNGVRAFTPTIDGIQANAKRSTLSIKAEFDSSLTKILGRHYDDSATQTLKRNSSEYYQISYPLAVDQLKLTETLLLGTADQVQVTLSNNSNRAYDNTSGDIQVLLTANSQGIDITNQFSALTRLERKSTTTKNGASILVVSEDDAFRRMSLDLKVVKNGVTLALLKDQLPIMAKVPFIAKKGAPVLVIDSNRDTDQVVTAIQQINQHLLGTPSLGTKLISLLDTSISENRKLMGQPLSNKSVVVLGLDSSDMQSVVAMLKTSDSAAVSLVGQGESSTAWRTLKGLNHVVFKPELNLEGREDKLEQPIYAVSKFKVSKKSYKLLRKNMSTFTRFEYLREIGTALKLSALFSMGEEELANTIKELSAAQIRDLKGDGARLFLQMLNTRVILELTNASDAYGESCSGWLWNRKCDKKGEIFGSLKLYNTLRGQTGSNLSSALVSGIVAFTAEDALDYHSRLRRDNELSNSFNNAIAKRNRKIDKLARKVAKKHGIRTATYSGGYSYKSEFERIITNYTPYKYVERRDQDSNN